MQLIDFIWARESLVSLISMNLRLQSITSLGKKV